jgi:DNA-binding NarL/FixJ family response regulator
MSEVHGHGARKIRILILDDHLLFREALAHLFETEPDLEAVAHCSTIAQALDLLGRTAVDIVLLDIDLRDESGADFPAAAVAAGYEGKILVVTGMQGAQDAARALRAGANGIFLKSKPAEGLADAIRCVYQGSRFIEPEFLNHLVDLAASGESHINTVAISSREREISAYVAQGLSNKEIASLLGISESGVKAALQRLFHKYGVRTRTQLARAVLSR